MKKIWSILILLGLVAGCKNIHGYDGYYPNQGKWYAYDTHTKKNVYLTFDDGFPSENTRKILDILKEKNVHATFFLEGEFFDDCASLIRRMVDEGHVVGNHTWSHRPITEMTKEEIKEEFQQVELKYFEITGTKMTKYFRPPFGLYTKEKLDYIESLGYDIFFWSVDYPDWDRDHELGKDYAVSYITNQTYAGDIILLHTLTMTNVEALPQIIDNVHAKKLIFQPLSMVIRAR